MVRGGRGGGFKEVVGLTTSPQQGGAKVSTEGCTLRYEIGHKKTHKRNRVIEQLPVNPNVARQKNPIKVC
jgi:hypothetical protein